MTLKPLADRVIVKPLEVEKTTKSGIILSTSAQDKPQIAEVISVGTDVDASLSPGDKVIVTKYAGTDVKLEDGTYSIVRQNDILGVLEEEDYDSKTT